MGRLTRTGPTVLVASLLFGAAACSSGEQLSPEQRVEAASIVEERAAVAMIDLSDEDRACAVDRLQPDDLVELRRDEPDVTAAADAVVSCVGPELIGASVLRSQAGTVSPASLDCAVRELDRPFVVELVAGAMAEEPPRIRTELEVARALGVCLGLEELLRQ